LGYDTIHAKIIAAADYVVLHRRDEETYVHPSRLVKIDDDGNLEVLRS
jgi:hypothetical protein